MRHALILAGLLACSSMPLRAQATPAPAPALRGIVRDSTGRPLSQVTVSHEKVKTISDVDGSFVLTPVPTGRITVQFTRNGNLLGSLEANVTNDTTPAVTLDVIADRVEPRTLLGTVVDQSGAPLRDVVVEVVTALVETRTDSAGRFVMRNLPARRHIVRVRRVGYDPTYLTADLTDSTSTRARIVVRQYAGQNLGLVVVRANGIPGRLQAFMRRAERKSGWGRIFTPDDIARRNPMRTSDMFQAVAGVRLNTDARGQVQLTGRGGCVLALFINGFPVPQMRGSGIDDLVNVLDLAGIEIYNGQGGLPAEYLMGRPNSCGTVGVWTR
jgi:Carboxypeptidase regulatory-like domain